MPQWDPTTYLQFDDERSRPFVDLVGRIGAVDPHTIVDLGCGPGGQTASLQARWPEAMITGFDSSPEMIASAAEHASDQVSFAVQDLRDWRPETPVDVIISNATLQWIPEHRALLPQLVDSLTSQGWLAFQVPGNFDEPSHRLLRELAREPAYAEFTQTVEQPDSSDPEDYLADLTALGCAVDAWETT